MVRKLQRSSWVFVVLFASFGCGGQGTEDATDAAHWSVVGEELSAALLSVWADDSEVFTVGADDGQGPLILRLRDGRWERLDSGERGNLWWVTDAPDGALWMVGEGGLVLRYDRAHETFERIDAPTNQTIFGIDFAGPGEALAVGGPATEGAGADPGGVVLRLHDGKFAADDRVDPAWLAGHTVFKVWTPDERRAWLVGEGGLVLQLDAGTYSRREAPTSDRLLTVHGASADEPLMVGGLNNATLIERIGGDFVDSSLELDEGFAPALNGVSSPSAKLAIVVGNRGFIAEREDDGPWTLSHEQVTDLHLHAVFVGPDGQAWAVGGDILTRALDKGVVLHRGPKPAPSI